MTDIEDDQDGTHPGWSRRTVLKGAAAGTALWAVPSVTSLATRASAASAQPCAAAFVCGDNELLCGGDQCLCIGTTSGAIVCSDLFASCGGACQSDTDCGPNEVCQNDHSGCCGQVCIPLCPGAAAMARSQTSERGRTSPNAGRHRLS